MKTFLVAVVYAPILPLSLVIAIVGIGMEYWIDKYILLRRHARPSRISDELSGFMTSTIPWAIALYAILLFIYLTWLHSEPNAFIAFVWMFIMIGYVVLPINTAQRLCSKTDE